MKYIRINTPKGQYDIELKKIAEDRANYYSTVDGYDIGSEEYQDEVNFVMDDDFEGIDWLLNNTNWSDWSQTAIKINDKVLVTDDDFFTSSDDCEIIDV